MKKFIWGTFVPITIIFLSACQRPPDYQGEKPVTSMDSVLEGVKPGLSEGQEEMGDLRAASIIVKDKPDTLTHIVVKVGAKLNNRNLECRLLTGGLSVLADVTVPFKLVSPHSSDGNPDPEFITALEYFTQIPKLNNRIEFLMWFHYGNYHLKALWRIVARPVRDPQTKVEECRTETEICDSLDYDEARNLHSCKTRKWGPALDKLEALGGLAFGISYTGRTIYHVTGMFTDKSQRKLVPAAPWPEKKKAEVKANSDLSRPGK